MSQTDQKRAAAEAAIEYVKVGDVVGIGTGSTADYFIEFLAGIKGKLDGAVASSDASAAQLRKLGIPLLDMNQVGTLPLYVDGADEATRNRHLIKGGGGALSREKIVAEASEKFVCIADQGKLVDRLGTFPLPIEVLEMARSMVARKLVRMGGQPMLRDGFVTDNGHPILDIRGLDIMNPLELERQINQIPGVVTVGLFALRPADMLLIGTESGVEII
ncbi:MAG: ribose-5-phosphate isomerase RpiA [Gammaproteobacteria bacterium]|nr:ribose-5-phosphate isomerase RpiA [Gammaproteobacteria bacterium]MCY4314398.1 ribose-5-phosphate isomerase RpiA [Gammaproteobacteria bacterium]